MSVYTEAEHAIALEDTLYWIDHPPVLAEQKYLYGKYQLRLKDYNAAYEWLKTAYESGVKEAAFDLGRLLIWETVDDDVTGRDKKSAADYFDAAWDHVKEQKMPDDENAEEIFQKAFLMRYGYGTPKDAVTAYHLFASIKEHYKELTPEAFDICCNYSWEGSALSSSAQVCKLPLGDACFQMAKYYLEDVEGFERNREKGRSLLREAYDFHCEEALFTDYTLFGEDFSTYEYQDEIKELFSFRIGQYVRVCEVHPSVKSYLRLISMYENGYPGDCGERKIAFAEKAKGLYQKKERLEKEQSI